MRLYCLQHCSGESWLMCPCVVVYLPLPPQDVLLHPLLRELLGLHSVGVLLQPGVFETLSAGQPSPEDSAATLSTLKVYMNIQ